MQYLRNAWYAASWSHDLTATRPIGITVIDEPIVLFRTETGAPTALRDCCCHRNAPLSQGRCEGGRLRCMYHGLLFDGAGQCVEVPGQRNIPPTCRVTSFPTAERGTLVWVWVGDPALADAALIPIPANLDTGSWQMRHAHCDLNANYMLMNDNLADMSHVAYLHEATFGAGDTRIAQTHPTVTALERGIRIERWLADRERVESWLPDGSRAPTESMQDLWLSYDLIAPGVFVMRTEIHAAGTARSCGYRIPSMPALHSNLNIQAVTPVSSGHSRHFFALGPLAAETVKDTSLPDVMFRIMLRGFEEDRRMLEAQERNLARWPIDPSSAIRHDRGVYLLRQIITRLLALENPAKSVSPSAIPLTAP